MKNKIFFPLILLSAFVTVAVVLWLTTGKIFYLLNFLYIGGFVAMGAWLDENNYKHSRLIVQLGVGIYMLLYLGVMLKENMQLEGFFYYLFLGVFQAAVIHYFVAKIAGPLLFGRGWCGYACWTAMVLDFLPYKIPQKPRIEKLGILRYLLFFISFLLVGGLFIFYNKNLENIMFMLFIVGNLVYYLVGITLALMLKDNRAFCKYICPITTLLKPASYFSFMRVKPMLDKCISCNKCLKVCPMNVNMLDPKRSRKNGTECILCLECVKTCPQKALKV
ncbi:MAG: 4Fe-4S binding protein [Clostridia bacterium]